jgi:hypothetical protein
MDTFTLGEIAEIVGAKSRRVPQVWAEAGVIHAEPTTERAGTGTHRRFSRDEAVIACFIQNLARRQIAIGELKAISEKLRAYLSTPYGRQDMETAIGGDRIADRVFLLLVLSSTPNSRDGSVVYRCESHKAESGTDVAAEIGRRATELLTVMPDGLSIIINATECLYRLRR